MEKKFLIPISIVVLILLIVLVVLIQPKEGIDKDIEGFVKFRLVDGNTGQPIVNQKIFVCDDSVKLRYIGEYPLSRFCDGEIRKIIKEISTDSSGIFLLDVKKINVKPPFSIVFDTGESDDRWGKVEIERSDTITHHFHPSHVRVVNIEGSGHVISNKLYNLDSKEVKEIFTSDGSEKNYRFEIIDLIVFKKK